MKRRDRRTAGFTLIEVMMAIAVMLIGTTALVGLQQVATRANIEGRERMMANQILENWTSRLKADALGWSPRRPLNQTQYLNQPLAVWSVPATAPAQGPQVPMRAAGFDYFGRDVALAAPDLRYCVAYRLDWVAVGSALRASLIVYWPRHGKGAVLQRDFPNCEGPITGLRQGQPLYQRYHALVSTTLLRRQP